MAVTAKSSGGMPAWVRNAWPERYTYIKDLGKGASGLVYHARDRVDDLDVALKFVQKRMKIRFLRYSAIDDKLAGVIVFANASHNLGIIKQYVYKKMAMPPSSDPPFWLSSSSVVGDATRTFSSIDLRDDMLLCELPLVGSEGHVVFIGYRDDAIRSREMRPRGYEMVDLAASSPGNLTKYVLGEIAIMIHLSQAACDGAIQGVLSLHAHHQTPSVAVLALEFAPEGDLKDLVYKMRRRVTPLASLMQSMKNVKYEMDPDMVGDLILQICMGVYGMHSQGVTHRDLKPENILVITSNPKPILKITDFGFSVRVDTSSSQIALPGDRFFPLQPATQHRTILGTVLFLAPELIILARRPGGVGYCAAHTDLFALGTAIYFVATGGHMFYYDMFPQLYDINIVNQMQQLDEMYKLVVKWESSQPAYESFLANRLKSRGVVDETLIDFISQLTRFDPNKRMEIIDALHHPYLASRLPSVESLQPTPSFSGINSSIIVPVAADQLDNGAGDDDDGFVLVGPPPQLLSPNPATTSATNSPTQPLHNNMQQPLLNEGEKVPEAVSTHLSALPTLPSPPTSPPATSSHQHQGNTEDEDVDRPSVIHNDPDNNDRSSSPSPSPSPTSGRSSLVATNLHEPASPSIPQRTTASSSISSSTSLSSSPVSPTSVIHHQEVEKTASAPSSPSVHPHHHHPSVSISSPLSPSCVVLPNQSSPVSSPSEQRHSFKSSTSITEASVIHHHHVDVDEKKGKDEEKINETADQVGDEHEKEANTSAVTTPMTSHHYVIASPSSLLSSSASIGSPSSLSSPSSMASVSPPISSLAPTPSMSLTLSASILDAAAAENVPGPAEVAPRRPGSLFSYLRDSLHLVPASTPFEKKIAQSSLLHALGIYYMDQKMWSASVLLFEIAMKIDFSEASEYASVMRETDDMKRRSAVMYEAMMRLEKVAGGHVTTSSLGTYLSPVLDELHDNIMMMRLLNDDSLATQLFGASTLLQEFI